ncbi:sulfate adenylyltransferase subunit 1 [Pollutimonas harenae]|uniref:sulfate adenylyltransferase n=1 Tax=Pollutimonas harenae TaxID=657015 RepID=A0A853GRW1_9BURK|nr:GTP-binding protein [Pollutimonas harenae]NYT84897.1 sulfate adenylyltransferase [Pollutimonas harenae]TEA72706.1 sulfate adenylyltransferase [Pollutimonas harenae]
MNAINDAWVSAQDAGVLRLITAGSVDDGKSTLIGRLLYDSKGVFADQMASIARSKYKRVAVDEIDLSLLTDGLEAEREQGITIDVAYRYFATPLRKFIIADAPGHEQYTRNMVTGASTAQAAIVLVDASRAVDGTLLPQTKRHSALARLLGLSHIVVAVNKMDLVGWDADVFDRIRQSYAELAGKLGIAHFHTVPLSALKGDNVVAPSANTPWYEGPTLLSLLETLPGSRVLDDQPEARFFVQWVIRHGGHSSAHFRGYAGQLAGASLRVGDGVKVLPHGQQARVARLLRGELDIERAEGGESITIVLDKDIDVSRGDLIVPADAHVKLAREFEAEVCWLDQQVLNPARQYWLKQGTRLTQARFKTVHTRRDIHELQDVVAAGSLDMNDIGRVTLLTRDVLALDTYTDQPATGAFILIDAATHQTVAAGMVR